ncbi:BON domain-containing protein [Pseudodesulfovibrio cashew]|uniref:BON domain-containing protein n=1 Tax=Pseudodesulfovibrio cashew TaxID=2678688 RepID=A0A6I6JG76_9BACT|nr:BON domain-containing protein [Pseudodesulfovibrio cashew]QGY40169.1 BON domain-containing protein [Pseudodesulfovibrio cashew]
MSDRYRHTTLLPGLLILIMGLTLAGCALYPAVQVAGGAMTGYDAVHLADDYLPRNSVEGGELTCTSDRMMERRLRERLAMDGQRTVSGHVINGEAYLVGRFTSRSQADRAVKVASTVEGLRIVHCKFYPMGPAREAQSDHLLLKELAGRLGKARRLDNADLRVEVVRSHAILIGRAGTWAQKTEAVAIASEVGGISDVVDYIVVSGQPASGKAKVAAN